MYTMLMMMAVTSGGEASAFGGRNKGCDGSSCQGAVVAASCQGSSCDGGNGFLGLKAHFAKHKSSCQGSSCTGTTVAASCTGATVAASCTGATVAGSCTGSSCQGSSCTGGSGFLGLKAHFAKHKSSCHGSSCTGAVVVAPASCVGGTVAPAPAVAMPAKEMPKAEEKK
jgi:hypothetical protein